MKRETIINEIKHINNVIEDLWRLRNLSETATYDLEYKAKLKYPISMIVDVSTDVMDSWRHILEEQLSKMDRFSDEEIELLQIAMSNLRCGLEDELEESERNAEIIDKINKCDKLFEKLLDTER